VQERPRPVGLGRSIVGRTYLRALSRREPARRWFSTDCGEVLARGDVGKKNPRMYAAAALSRRRAAACVATSWRRRTWPQCSARRTPSLRRPRTESMLGSVLPADGLSNQQAGTKVSNYHHRDTAAPAAEGDLTRRSATIPKQMHFTSGCAMYRQKMPSKLRRA
jgi:hypothetical protein